MSTASFVLGEDAAVEEIELTGGVANKGAVVRVGDTVRRPASAQSPEVAALLGYLESVGFCGVPRFLGFDDSGREVLSWIAGDVPLPPFPSWSMTDRALVSVARLLRSYHDAAAGFILDHPSPIWSRELADPCGGELLCHNDVCPENVVFQGDEAVAILDFDFVAPGRRLWDVVGTLSMWAPLAAPEWRRAHRTTSDPIDRAGLFVDEYGLGEDERRAFSTTLRERWQVGRSFVRAHLEAGDAAFEEMAEDHGAEDRWEATDRWFDVAQPRLERRLRPSQS